RPRGGAAARGRGLARRGSPGGRGRDRRWRRPWRGVLLDGNGSVDRGQQGRRRACRAVHRRRDGTRSAPMERRQRGRPGPASDIADGRGRGARRVPDDRPRRGRGADKRSRRLAIDWLRCMPTFIMLSTLGPDGAATLRDNPDRIRAVTAEVEAMGVKVVAQYALFGDYDFLNIIEAP